MSCCKIRDRYVHVVGDKTIRIMLCDLIWMQWFEVDGGSRRVVVQRESLSIICILC